MFYKFAALGTTDIDGLVSSDSHVHRMVLHAKLHNNQEHNMDFQVSMKTYKMVKILILYRIGIVIHKKYT